MKKDFLKAIKYTIPCLFSYFFLGIAFGISLNGAGFGVLYSFLSSTFVFAGSMQFMMINFLSSQEPLYLVAITTIIVNARYAAYGLSFNEHYKDLKWYHKGYLIYTLSDETYSILVATSLPFKNESKRYDTFVHSLNHVYWIIGCIAGSLIGNLKISFDGIDFVMTSLFVVIYIDQLRSTHPKSPGLIGLMTSSICLFIFGPKFFLIPALIITIILLIIFRKKLEKGYCKKECNCNDIND